VYGYFILSLSKCRPHPSCFVPGNTFPSIFSECTVYQELKESLSFIFTALRRVECLPWVSGTCFSGFPLPLVTDENKTSTGESKTPAIVTLANWICNCKWRMCNFIEIRISLTLLHLTRPNQPSPHLFNPAGSAHTCIQISRTYDSCHWRSPTSWDLA
jgi:hypothetical protein